MNSFYTKEELKKFNFKEIGENVLISKNCQIYNPEKTIIKNNVRIDDFVIISGEIYIGNYVHIGAYSFLSGSYGIELNDFSGISIRGIILTANDDWSGEYLQNPMVPIEYRKLTTGKVILKEYANVGSGSTIFPGVVLEEGVAVGAGCLVFKSILKKWTLNVNKASLKLIAVDRSEHMKTLGEKLINDLN